jgi:hypothetical protein
MANTHKTILVGLYDSHCSAEVQVQLEEKDATKEKSEEKMPVQGSTAEGSPTDDRLPEKDHEEGNLAEDSVKSSEQVDEETLNYQQC